MLAEKLWRGACKEAAPGGMLAVKLGRGDCCRVPAGMVCEKLPRGDCAELMLARWAAVASASGTLTKLEVRLRRASMAWPLGIELTTARCCITGAPV